MRPSVLRSWLMASTGVAVLIAGPAWAQQDSECARQLDQMQEKLQQGDVAQERRGDVQLVIDGARTLAESGDEEGCERVSAELDQLMQTLTGTGDQAAGQTQAAGRQGEGQSPGAGAQQSEGAQQPQGQQQPAQDEGQATIGQGQQATEAEADMTARLTIEQPQPQITVHQQPPKVTVRIPKPVITIRMPPPEVDIQMPEPDVQVELPEPEIRVSMAQPELQVQGAQAQAAAGQGRGEQIQANIEYQRSGQQQPQIDVQMEEPEVRIEQAEPRLDITGAGAQQEAQEQQQATAGQGQEPNAGAQQQAAAAQQPVAAQQLPGQQGIAAEERPAEAGQQADAPQGAAAQQQEPSTPGEIASQGDVSTPDHQVRQAIDEAQMALQQDDVETARSTLEDARQELQQVAGQAGDEAQRRQLDEVGQHIQQALDAIEQDDVQTAQQALEDAKVPMQEATQQQASQQAQGEQQDQGTSATGIAGPAPSGGDQQPAMADQEPGEQPETNMAEGSEQQPGAAAEESPLAQIPASELLGQDVVNEQGETVAEIVDMVKRSDTEEILAVLSVGGFLGLGQKEVAMPLERFDVGADQEIILSNATEEELKNMPDWDDDGTFESVSQ